MKRAAATTTATSTAAPQRIMRVSMRHQRRLECVSSARSNLSCRFRARSLYSHSASEMWVTGVGAEDANGAEGANGGPGFRALGAAGGDQSSMSFTSS